MKNISGIASILESLGNVTAVIVFGEEPPRKYGRKTKAVVAAPIRRRRRRRKKRAQLQQVA